MHRRPAPFASLRPLLRPLPVHLAPLCAAALVTGCGACEPNGASHQPKTTPTASLPVHADGQRSAAAAPAPPEAQEGDLDQPVETYSVVFTDADGNVLGEDLFIVDDRAPDAQPHTKQRAR